MLKLSKLTDYATVIMTYLAKCEADFLTARDIATKTRINLPTVSKILKQLTRHQLLVSERGSTGGYKLIRQAKKITLAEIISAMENNLAITECAMDHSTCHIEPYCFIKGNWRLISMAIHTALDGISLAELANPLTQANMHGLKTIPIKEIRDTE